MISIKMCGCGKQNTPPPPQPKVEPKKVVKKN